MGALLCIDERDVVAKIIPGTIAVGFRECGRYRFQTPLEGCVLYVDEAPLAPAQHNGAPCWVWEPGFYAGQVVAELVGTSGQTLAEYRLDVSPDGNKLGADAFDQMLDDLYAFNPVLLLGTEEAQTSIGVSGEVTSPLLAYARLRRYGDGLLAGLKAVAAQPLSRLRRERVLVPYHRVRQLDSTSACNLMRRPDTAAFLLRNRPMEGVPLVDVNLSTNELDNPANRALTAALLAVRRRCVQVADALQYMAMREEDSDTRTSLQPRLARRLEFLHGLAEGLAKILRLEPYASVTRVEITAAGLNAISAHPIYARAYRFAWSILRPGVAGDARDESLWLSPTWEIYERWCFTQVAGCLQNRHGDLSWSILRPNAMSDSIRMVGSGSTMRVEAALQPRFSSGGDKGFSSVSLQLQPDVTVTVESGGVRRLLVLDAKYRTSRQNVLDAMRSAHTYQDALRWNGERAVGSVLLVPRGGGAPWLEDPAFQMTHGVGVHVLAPDQPATGLSEAIERWLSRGDVAI